MNATQHEGMTAEAERAAARQILELEDSLRVSLRDIPACRPILDASTDHMSRTRHGSVQRLAEATRLAREYEGDAVLVAHVVSVSDQAQALRWQLALSASRVVRRETRRMPPHRVAIEDLEQEAALGLFAAAERFDPDQGVRFAVYARWWVRAQLTRSLQLSATFQVSAAALELHRNARKLIRSDEQDGVKRTMVQMALELHVRPERLREVFEAGAQHAARDDGDAVTCVADLPDNSHQDPESCVVSQDVAKRLRSVIQSTFDERDRIIVTHRFGLDVPAVSVPALAEGLALSAERVRQLEGQCLAVLREVFKREMDV